MDYQDPLERFTNIPNETGRNVPPEDGGYGACAPGIVRDVNGAPVQKRVMDGEYEDD